LGEVFVVNSEGGGHYSVSVAGGPVEALVGDLGDQAVAAEFGDEAGDSGASTVSFVGVGWWMWV